ncbi:MAG: DNA-processing protein DprA [Demequina sp.]
MSGSEREAWIAWSALAEPADPAACWLVDVMGPVAALEWVRTAGDDTFAASVTLAPYAPPAQVEAAVAASQKWVARLDVADAQVHLERAASVGARAVTRNDQGWPQAFEALGALAPFALWVRGVGDVAQMWGSSIAVVGARASTSYGDYMAATVSAGVADRGWCVMSGGAYGIDGAAHRATLACDAPSLAVMAGGVDRLYPAGHQDMLAALLDRGAVVSEVPPGYAPHRSRFLTRNRLIAAASATVVVEAATRSGSLSTARHAAHQGRPVAAVPGPVTSASSAGCHDLIREGVATLETAPEEVVELASPLDGPRAAPSVPRTDGSPTGAAPDFSSSHERAAYDGIGPQGRSTDAVAHRAGLTIEEAQVALGGLELAGLARRDGPVWRRQPPRTVARA